VLVAVWKLEVMRGNDGMGAIKVRLVVVSGHDSFGGGMRHWE